MWPFDPNKQDMYQKYAQAYNTGNYSNIDPNEAQGQLQQFVQNAPPNEQQQVFQQHFSQMPPDQRAQLAQQFPPEYGGGGVDTLGMALVVRRFLGRMATAFDEVGRIPNGWFSAIIVGVLLSAYVTEEINIAFIFGGFVMGMIMPRHARLTEEFTRRIEDFVVTLLLPVFFVYTGLRTNIGLLNRPELWLITLALIAIAILGKLAGAAIAARTSGMSWRESAVVGTLMNTRGLTELIVLNLALSVGAISNVLFAALVIMAFVTTLMAGPLLKLLDRKNEYGSKVEDEFDEAARRASRDFPQITVPERSILVAAQTDAALNQLLVLAEPLARSEPAHELIIARPVRPSRSVGAGVRGGLQTESLALERSSRIIDDVRARLADEQTAARGVAFTTANLSGDLLDSRPHALLDDGQHVHPRKIRQQVF